MITSPHNERLKEVRLLATRKGRARTGRFVAEGEDLVLAADAAGWQPTTRLGDGGLEVDPKLLAGVSQLGSGTRVIGVYEQRWADAPQGPVCLALHGVSDPGNVGTLLRSAAAFGVDTVAFGPNCADPFSPKSVRASMGAIFTVPVARYGGDPAELPGSTVALAARTGEPLARVERPFTLLVGAERTGLPDDVIAKCDRAAHIPIETESLNVAMAATVALYETTRISPRP